MRLSKTWLMFAGGVASIAGGLYLKSYSPEPETTISDLTQYDALETIEPDATTTIVKYPRSIKPSYLANGHRDLDDAIARANDNLPVEKNGAEIHEGFFLLEKEISTDKISMMMALEAVRELNPKFAARIEAVRAGEVKYSDFHFQEELSATHDQKLQAFLRGETTVKIRHFTTSHYPIGRFAYEGDEGYEKQPQGWMMRAKLDSALIKLAAPVEKIDPQLGNFSEDSKLVGLKISVQQVPHIPEIDQSLQDIEYMRRLDAVQQELAHQPVPPGM